MKKWLSVLAAAALLAGCQASDDTAKTPLQQSLRGDAAITGAVAPSAMPAFPAKGTSVAQTFVGQPPVVPHKVSYEINKDKNGCVSCHRIGKRKMAASHFEQRQVKGKYYQCKSCHVPQAEGVMAQRTNLF